MKKFGISVLLTAALFGFGLNSCDKDEFTEEDAMNLQAKLDKQQTHEQDSLQLRNQRVTYTVNVVDASTSTLKSGSMVSAITGAVVKVVQDTMIITKTVDASGVASFANLRPGQANVNITLTGYSEVNYTVNISTSSYTGSRMASNIIPLIPVTGTSSGTIKGKVVYESDLTNLTPEIAPVGTKILAMVRPSSSALPSVGNNGIVAISYDKLSLSATTDANGEFTMTVPATVNGLDYDIIIADFTVGQKLLQPTYNNRDTFGVLTIPTSFGTSFQSASNVVEGAPVIVTIGAPDYSNTPAVATAVIDNPNGISHINITNNGGLYAPNANYTIALDNGTIRNSSTITTSANFSVNSYGRLTSISVPASGANYLAAAENYELTIPYVHTEAVVTVNTVNGSGAITSFTITNGGRYYVNKSEDVLFGYNTTGGTGAQLSATFGFSGGAYVVNGVNIVNGGSGYTVGQTFNVKSNISAPQFATGRLNMTTGSLSAINVTNQGANYISGQVSVVIGSPNIPGGTQATATANITAGKISSITINTPGSGYTSVPAVTIVNKAEKIQAIYYAEVSDGKITGFDDSEQGNGYLSVPSVTITSAIPNAGNGGKANANVSGGKVTSLSLVNSGNGYRGNIPSSEKDFSGSTFVNVKGSSTSILNFNLGTGKRSVEE